MNLFKTQCVNPVYHMKINCSVLSGRFPKRLFLALLLCLSSGCSTINMKSIPFLDKEPEFETPLQVIPVWSNTVLHQSGKHGTRGFGGRVLFYGEKKEKAVRVDGTLIVYAWDDTEDVANRQADRKYVFKAEKLQDHYSDSKIGHSYNFWLPWDAAGGNQERISLIIRFIGSNGAEVNSEPTNVVLPGPISKPKTMIVKHKKRDSNVRHANAESDTLNDRRVLPVSYENNSQNRTASYEAPARSDNPVQSYNTVQDQQPLRETNQESIPNGRRMKTSEIQLTAGFIERNLQGTNAGFSGDDLFAPQLQGNPAVNTSHHYEQEPVSQPQQSNHRQSNQEAIPLQSDSQGSRIQQYKQGVTRSSIRSQSFRSRVQTARATRPDHDHVRRKPLPAKSLNGLPLTPR